VTDMNRPTTAGERQTVNRVVHPQRGEGWAVYSNGPSFFQPLDGEPIPMKVSVGGGNKDGSWTYIVDPEHGTVQAKDLSRGELHQPKWHSLLGPGWLVYEGGGKERFEADSGQVIRFELQELCVGTPDYARRMKRSRTKSPPMTVEEEHWMTITTSTGEVLAFRDGPPPEPEPPVPPPPAQGSLFGGEP
jgi:hypothetical protein